MSHLYALEANYQIACEIIKSSRNEQSMAFVTQFTFLLCQLVDNYDNYEVSKIFMISLASNFINSHIKNK